ncbi:MAG: BTAD domain-containing putative transcriptional regulator, partial [Chloroflexota bacterium]
HIILASRVHPGIHNLMLLAGRRQLVGFDEDILRVDGSEVAAILGEEYQAEISSEVASALSEQMDGWITGILLSYASTPTPVPLQATRQDITVGHPIYQFFVEQAFDRQSPDVQSFLLDSALLEDLHPTQCDMVLQRNDSGQMLSALRSQHLFISEIDAGVLRYHPLFREFLLERYRTTDAPHYHATALRIAEWYREQEQWSRAFDMYLVADDLEGASTVISAGGEQLFMQGRLETLERWFQTIPNELLDVISLCLRARILVGYRGNYHEASLMAQMAESKAHSGEMVHVYVINAYLARHAGKYIETIKAGEQALQLTTDPMHQAMALRMIATCRHILGATQQAIEELKQALDLERSRGNFYNVALIQQDLGFCYEGLGKLKIAEECFYQADAYWDSINNASRRTLTLNNIGVVQHRIGYYYEANKTFVLALNCAQNTEAYHTMALIYLSQGDMLCDLQQWEEAARSYNYVQQINSPPDIDAYLTLAHVRLWVRQEQFASATELLKRIDLAKHPHSIMLNVLQARIMVGKEEFSQAQQLLDDIFPLVEHNPTERACAYLIQAVLYAEQYPDQPELLVAALEQAAHIADQIGHDRFLGLDTQISSQLLQRAQAAGWSRAATWLDYRQEALRVAQTINPTDQRPTLVIRNLGTDQILLDGQEIELGWAKAREVLHYLLFHSDGATSEELREAIWPDLSPERSRDALKRAVYRLRAVLPRDLITLHGRIRYRVDPSGVQLDYDVRHFLHLLNSSNSSATDEARTLALDAYHGPFLPQSDSEWASHQRTMLEQRYLEALHRTAECYEQMQALQDALRLYRRIIAVDNLDEAAHAGIMRCALAMDRRAAVVDQYRQLQQLLLDELGLTIEKDSEAEHLYQQAVSLT